ncbi:hypothetical protein B0H16DRAFT_1463810 [Mycena metata]|uniref:C2H2-type domain-containing protein n=1 Tax=Mycena metata TaxID=1033252 RepID=A0AAD7IJQ6_9AGAR|nr:hypothetical protein B0H16DRAFT_1463810 [Mycena metata]
MSSSVLPTLGAALAGCLVAVGLSAVLGFQTFLYFQIFPSDAHQYKVSLSKQNWWLTGPIAVLSIVRVGLAFGTLKFVNVNSPDNVLSWRKATTTEMLLSKTFPAFAARFKVTSVEKSTSNLPYLAVLDPLYLGLGYICNHGCDILFNVRASKFTHSRPHEAVDAVVVFTINDGCLTCAVVIVSIVCWLSMPHNFVYLGIYFTIAKLYANSVLATLNLRNWYRHRYIQSRPIGLSIKQHPPHVNVGHDTNSPGANSDLHGRPVQSANIPGVFVDHQVEYVNDFALKDHEDGHSNLSRNSVVEIA